MKYDVEIPAVDKPSIHQGRVWIFSAYPGEYRIIIFALHPVHLQFDHFLFHIILQNIECMHFSNYVHLSTLTAACLKVIVVTTLRNTIKRYSTCETRPHTVTGSRSNLFPPTQEKTLAHYMSLQSSSTVANLQQK